MLSTDCIPGVRRRRGSLHEDDPRIVVELLRFIYGLQYDQSHVDSMGVMQFLAATYVTAAKYQLVGLKDKTKSETRERVTEGKLRCWETDRIDDFLNATETVVAGTTQEDGMRELMIDYCFWHLPFLTGKVTRFSALLADNTGLKLEIFTRFNLHLSPYEGSWYCGSTIGKWHLDARSSCRECSEPISKRFMLLHRSPEEWKCRDCYHQGQPYCSDTLCATGTDSDNVPVWWAWNTEHQEN